MAITGKNTFNIYASCLLLLLLLFIIFAGQSYGRTYSLTENKLCGSAGSLSGKKIKLGAFSITIPQGWKKESGGDDSSAMFIKKKGTSVISLSLMKPTGEGTTLLETVKFLRHTELDSGKISASSIKKFNTCNGASGYRFALRCSLGKDDKFFEWHIYLEGNDGNLCHVIFSTMSKKNFYRKDYARILKGIKSL